MSSEATSSDRPSITCPKMRKKILHCLLLFLHLAKFNPPLDWTRVGDDRNQRVTLQADVDFEVPTASGLDQNGEYQIHGHEEYGPQQDR